MTDTRAETQGCKGAAGNGRSLRIAMLGHKRIPGREGGVEIVVRELAVRMVERGHRVTVYNRWDLFTPGGKVGGKAYRGIQIVQVPTLHDGKLNAVIYSVLAALRASVRHFDIYHFHAIGSCAMIWLPHMLGRKTIATVHGLDWQRAKWSRFASMYLQFGERMAAKYADQVIVLSRANQQYFMERYKRETMLIPNGMEMQRVPQPDIITAKYSLNRYDYVLYLARIVPEKGLHYLLEAFKQIDTRLHLVIAGRIDWEDAYCQRIVEMSKEDPRVIMTDFVQGHELAELFGNCSVYVLPSDVEGMPLSLLEAISYGARCLVSDIDENVDAAMGHATLFRHGDVESLRAQLAALIKTRPEAQCFDDDAKWLTWDDVTDRTLSLYNDVLRPSIKPSHGEKEVVT